QDTTGKGLKRRGLIAGAAALVAGLMAKQGALPVSAAASLQFANTTTAVDNNAVGPTGLISQAGYTASTAIFTAEVFDGAPLCAIQGAYGGRPDPPVKCGIFGYAGAIGTSSGVVGRSFGGSNTRGV